MSDNLLNRLRQNRKRAIVQEREDTLVTPEVQAEPTPAPTSATSQTQKTLAELKQQLEQFPATRRHSAIVLEEEVDRQLTHYCKEQGITVETFLEAAWQITSTQPSLLDKILEEAKHRYKSRKQAGKLRRLITMLSKQ